jgi:hypothetical protein
VGPRVLLFALFAAGCSFGVRGLPIGGGGQDLGSPSSPQDLASPGGPVDLATFDLTPAADLTVLPPYLSGQHADIPGAVDLTTEGVIDWVHFGLYASTDVDRKSGAPALITLASTGTVNQYASYGRNFTWSDGAPTTSASTYSGIYVRGLGNGHTISVPTDGTLRTLRVYVCNYPSTAQLTAHLDGTTDYVDSETANNADTYDRYTIAFRGPAGGTLTVNWKMTDDQGSGSVDVFGATLY